MQLFQRVVLRALVTTAAAAMAAPMWAGPITLGDWRQFSFTDPGVPAAGCDPADPTGGFCIPSAGTPTTFLDAPPWTFTAPAEGALLLITDLFLAGDRFEVFDTGASLGVTSGFLGGASCGDDPVVCLGTPGMSTGTFPLSAGSHSVTVVPTPSMGGGTGAFQVQAVPEPSTAILVACGFLFVGIHVVGRKEVRS
jgi:hypothetical protein